MEIKTKLTGFGELEELIEKHRELVRQLYTNLHAIYQKAKEWDIEIVQSPAATDD